MKREQSQSILKEWSVTNRGFSLVEVILATAVFVLLVTALSGAYLYGEEATALAGNRARATMLALEGLEAVRNIRDAAFVNLTDGAYGLATTSNQWNLSGSSDINNIFTRQIIISPVDSKRKSITANVTWPQNPVRSGTVALTTRLTNWPRAVSVVGDWSTTTLAATINFSGAQNGLKIQVQGNYAYVTRNNSSATNFFVINITNPASPVVAGFLTLSGVPQNLVVAGNYAYIASSDDNQELQIVNISTPALPSLAGSYNAPGTANGSGVAAVGATVYLIRASSANNEFNIINASVPTSPTLLGSRDLANNTFDVVVAGNYAYVSTADNTQEIKVINISTSASPTQAGSLNLPGSTDGGPLTLAGTAAFIGQGSTVYTVNIAAPASPFQAGSIGASGLVNDLALNLGNNDTYLFMATASTTAEFQVLNVSTLSAPSLLGSRDIAGANPLLGIAYDTTFDRAFAVGQSDTQEFIVIAPK